MQIYSVQTWLVFGTCNSSRYPCETIHNQRNQPTRKKNPFKRMCTTGKTVLISALCMMKTHLLAWQMTCWCQIQTETNISCRNINVSCISLYLSLVAVEKLMQMNGCRKPQMQKRCKTAFGIQTTKEECGLMKETKIKPELYRPSQCTFYGGLEDRKRISIKMNNFTVKIRHK